MDEGPPNKKVKNEFKDLIISCYDLKFVKRDTTAADVDIASIRKVIESAKASSDISFGATKTEAKINWGKCLGILIEDGPPSLLALKILTEKLNPGGGLL